MDHPWSIGTGISISSAGLVFGDAHAAVCCYTGFFPSGLPAVSLSLERLIDPSTALMVGATGEAQTRSTPATIIQPGSTVTTGTSMFAASLLAGVRRELTDPEAPFPVSVRAALLVGYGMAIQESTSANSNGVRSVSSNVLERAYHVGVLAGIAVDKLLAERLTLRIAAQLFSAGYSKTTLPQNTTGTEVTVSGLDVRLAIDPSIELRLAF
jgi:hypothetical protein